MNGFTDIHHHLLWGMDDGPRSAGEMRAMLRRAGEQGIGRIIATPHAVPGIERFDREQYDRALSQVRSICREEKLEMEVLPGAEILYTDHSCRFLEEGRVPALADTGHVLVEFSPDVRWERLCAALGDLQRHGWIPVVAHAERYGCLVRHPSRLVRLRGELDARFQVNCGAILRGKGFATRRFVKKMLEWDLLDFIATDAHRPDGARAANMRGAWQVLEREIGASRADELAGGRRLFETT